MWAIMLRVLGFLLSLSTLSALAADLQILNVYPGAGSVAGGDAVTVIVSYRNPPVICDPMPCDYFVDVYFGDVKAPSAVNAGNGVIDVITPPHARGKVPVSVELLGEKKTRYDYTFVDREDPLVPSDNYEKIIIPAAVSAPGGANGAFGSLWKSELWVTNRNSAPVELFIEDPRCAPGTGCSGTGYPALAAGETRKLSLPAGTPELGRIVHVQKGGAANVVFSLRIRDVSRSEDNHGTELPLAREADLRTDGITILNVPIDSRSRAALRIYSNEPVVRDIPVRITLTPIDGGAGPVSKTLTLNVTPADRFFMAYAQASFIGDLRNEFPELAEGTYRIDVQNADPVFVHALWALASVTNNRTQLVTAVVPQ